MKVYLLGIGGIGISALARYYLAQGWQVGGCNESASEITASLEKLGLKIDICQELNAVPPDSDLIIYSNALKIAAPGFLAQVQALGRPTRSYPQALGEITKGKRLIAVAGTHGKTTTTAMLAHIMIAAGLEPTVIVGSLMTVNGERTNFVAGASDYFLLEADEYQRAFLELRPEILVITNIDLDHLDYYRDLADIQSAFDQLAGQSKQVIRPENYKKIALPIKLQVPGQHNQENAQAALAAARELGISETVGRAALENFAGTWRRFEFRGTMPGQALVYDDYAHNPPKVWAAIQGAKEMFPERKIIAVFQPHLYSRTKLLFADFVRSLLGADEVVLVPIYAAREPLDPSINSQQLAVAITEAGHQARYLENFPALVDYLRSRAGPADLVLLLGAGDISQLAPLLLQ